MSHCYQKWHTASPFRSPSALLRSEKKLSILSGVRWNPKEQSECALLAVAPNEALYCAVPWTRKSEIFGKGQPASLPEGGCICDFPAYRRDNNVRRLCAGRFVTCKHSREIRRCCNPRISLTWSDLSMLYTRLHMPPSSFCVASHHR